MPAKRWVYLHKMSLGPLGLREANTTLFSAVVKTCKIVALHVSIVFKVYVSLFWVFMYVFRICMSLWRYLCTCLEYRCHCEGIHFYIWYIVVTAKICINFNMVYVCMRIYMFTFFILLKYVYRDSMSLFMHKYTYFINMYTCIYVTYLIK